MTTYDLPTTPAERRTRIADIILHHPEAWNQDDFFDDNQPPYTKIVLPVDAASGAAEFFDGVCTSTACVAGWGVLLSPAEEVTAEDWGEAGAKALGFTDDLADVVFYATDNDAKPWLPDALRRLGKHDRVVSTYDFFVAATDAGAPGKYLRMIERSLPEEKGWVSWR